MVLVVADGFLKYAFTIFTPFLAQSCHSLIPALKNRRLLFLINAEWCSRLVLKIQIIAIHLIITFSIQSLVWVLNPLLESIQWGIKLDQWITNHTSRNPWPLGQAMGLWLDHTPFLAHTHPQGLASGLQYSAALHNDEDATNFLKVWKNTVLDDLRDTPGANPLWIGSLIPFNHFIRDCQIDRKWFENPILSI